MFDVHHFYWQGITYRNCIRQNFAHKHIVQNIVLTTVDAAY